MNGNPAYQPPYTVTRAIVHLVAQISEALGRLIVLTDKSRALRLRRGNRIRTIGGSQATEGNILKETQITAIKEGKRAIIAPPHEIQEVQNALAACDRFEQWQPEAATDLLSLPPSALTRLAEGTLMAESILRSTISPHPALILSLAVSTLILEVHYD